MKICLRLLTLATRSALLEKTVEMVATDFDVPKSSTMFTLRSGLTLEPVIILSLYSSHRNVVRLKRNMKFTLAFFLNQRSLLQLGFSEAWTSLVISVDLARSLKQGDPPSSYLFILVMEIKDSLQSLEKNTGLRINNEKSSIYLLVNPATNVKDDVLSILGWSIETLPMQYLGLPVFYGKLKEVWCQPLLDKVDKHHAAWKASILSCARRICLLKHVLTSVVNYWMTIFALPRKVINKLNSSVAAFLWAVGRVPRASTILLGGQAAP
ncbi:uncharacterized protein LOC116256580 [Nymphaea colorata]|uniref:uncharacterized protein LOC116256580 n=1 Tax=Nymphaea colorata TaxID=210225 RepID=UPI00129EC93F|nr:uncharacterized protein LOC116256580 [Nymphaea colorata]